VWRKVKKSTLQNNNRKTACKLTNSRSSKPGTLLHSAHIIKSISVRFILVLSFHLFLPIGFLRHRASRKYLDFISTPFLHLYVSAILPTVLSWRKAAVLTRFIGQDWKWAPQPQSWRGFDPETVKLNKTGSWRLCVRSSSFVCFLDNAAVVSIRLSLDLTAEM
jgi:hypothetical protein